MARRKVIPKSKVWSKKVADTKFSKWIRERDGWRCRKCDRDFEENPGGLHCSHFWSRLRATTRYDPDNCIALCYNCHFGHRRGWEFEKQGDYRTFMMNWLGEEKYKELERRARKMMPMRDSILRFMGWYNTEEPKVGGSDS